MLYHTCKCGHRNGFHPSWEGRVNFCASDALSGAEPPRQSG